MSERIERIQIAVMAALLETDEIGEMATRALAALGESLGYHAAAMWALEEHGPRLVARWGDDSARAPRELHDGGPRMTESVLSMPVPIDGSIGWFIELHAATPRPREPGLLDPLGRLARVVGTTLHRSRTRARLEAELRLGKAKLDRLQASDVIGVMVTTTDGRILEANNAALQLLGYTRDELEAGTLRWDTITPPEWLYTDARAVEQLTASGVANAWHKEYVRRDGSRVPIIIGAASLGGDPIQTIVFVVDITAQKEVERELETLNAQLEVRVARRSDELRALAGRLQNVREEQLAELSREIHDVFGQDLAVLKVDVAWLLRRLAAETIEPSQLAARATAMMERLDGLHTTIRRIASQLRPRILDDLGLVAAIEAHARELARRLGLAIELVLPDEIPIPPELATAVFRIYQELMTNVLRHASATRVEVSMTGTDSEIHLHVVDNGIGIDKTVASPSSLGLVGIRERALAYGGVFSIGPAPGGGTEATLRLPRPESAS